MRTFLLIIILSLVFCSGCKIVAQDPELPKTRNTLRVLTFNILHGATMRGDFNLDLLANVIKKTNPDLVALQEVDYKTQRAQNYDLITELGWRTKMAPLFGRAMYYDGGSYGNGILSKYPFLATKSVKLPHSLNREPRMALEVLIELPSGDTIALVSTHLDHHADETDRINQVKTINDVFLNSTYPTILAGDLNDIPDSEPINILEEFWTATYNPNNPEPTSPSGTPIKKIDYIMYYPQKTWKIVYTEVINDPIATDHCAYLVELELK